MSNPLDPKYQLKVKNKPLQDPGKDEILRETVFGGPNTGRDVRLYLDVKTLEYLMNVARSSNMQTCMIGRAGICIQVYKSNGGHVYEVWKIIGDKPKPVSMGGISL